MHSSYDRQCLAIFTSVDGNDGLDDAARMEARWLGISPEQARGAIVAIAAGLYPPGS
jgi:hypothetical protein